MSDPQAPSDPRADLDARLADVREWLAATSVDRPAYDNALARLNEFEEWALASVLPRVPDDEPSESVKQAISAGEYTTAGAEPSREQPKERTDYSPTEEPAFAMADADTVDTANQSDETLTEGDGG